MSVWISHEGPDLTAGDYDNPGLIYIDVAGTNANGGRPVRLSLTRFDADSGEFWPDEEGRAVVMTVAETRELITRLTAAAERWGPPTG